MHMGSPAASLAAQASGPSSTVRAYVAKARNSLQSQARLQAPEPSLFKHAVHT